MAASKAALKNIKAALDGQKYDEAVEGARKILQTEKDNYHAHVFLGLALEKQSKNDESEKAYHAATISNPAGPLAWQGLISLYEKQAGKKIDQYGQAALHVAEYYMKLDEREKCQNVVDKYVGFAKQHGTRSQYRAALEVMLPTSPLYDYLEGRVPHPSSTYLKVAEITEAEERDRMNREIGERRTRLGAKIGQVTTEVKREVYDESPLELLYESVINWSQDDEIRRAYEEKLLQRAYDTLVVLQPNEKAEKAKQVRKLADGLVILKHPFALAWTIVLEFRDVALVEELDESLLQEYMELFPDDGLTKVLTGYMDSDISPFRKPRASQDDTSEPEPLTAEERLILMVDGSEESSRSILSQRLMAEYFIHLEEYGSTVDCATRAIDLLESDIQATGVDRTKSLDAARILLGTALIHHETPRRHAEARRLFDGILLREPLNTSALIGVGLILEEEEDFAEAIEFFGRALEQSQDPKIVAEEAWCRAQLGAFGEASERLQKCLDALEVTDSKSRNLKSEILYRVGVCLWNLDASKTGRKDRRGPYARFLASLQLNISFAPAYTSLGIYYADYGKDRTRARKCFQKAFELSLSEVEAAERLARAFADGKDWESVEVVAQRVIQSGKVRPPPGSKKKGLSWPFAALGVCQLNNQDFPHSIVSYQAALRISPTDFNSWVGLGESYHSSGRYIAATKALEQALQVSQSQEPGQNDIWFARYMLANVKRELGDYDAAIAGYEVVLQSRENEYGVAVALLQAHVEYAWRNLELGLFGRAAAAAAKAIDVAESTIKMRSDAFNVWKAVGDACSISSWIRNHADEFPLQQVLRILESQPENDAFAQLSELDQTRLDLQASADEAPVAPLLRAAILSHKRALHVCAQDMNAQAVAWYNLGWTEYRAHQCLYEEMSKAESKSRPQYLKAAVRCFKRAIELEAGNADFWNALGIVTSHLNAKVSQHSFVRSLHLKEMSARTWTNLGTLCLMQEDLELAHEAFVRAQSADPEYAHAWLGQGILALITGNAFDAANHFAHAFEIADSTSILTKRLYATSMFDHVKAGGQIEQIADLLQPLFALHQLKSQMGTNAALDHLRALFAERVGLHGQGIAALDHVCSVVEADFEATESPESLACFAQAKADLARAQLAAHEFSDAISSAELCLDLSSDPESGALDPQARQKYRLSALLTAGLAYHFAGSFDKAIPLFRSALTESLADPDVVCLLSQVLWAKGGDNERAIAREQLLECAEKHPSHVGTVTLLGVFALLDGDVETVAAVRDDLHHLRANGDLEARQEGRIGKLLGALAALEDETGEASRLEAATAVMLAPARPYGWMQLAKLAAEEQHPAEMAVLVAEASVPPRGALEGDDLAKALTGTGRVADAMRAVMLAPWEMANWEALEEGSGCR